MGRIVNTTNGPEPRDPDLRRGHVVNTSRILEEDLQYVDEDPAEIIAVLPAGGWTAALEGEDGLRRIALLVAWVAQDSGRLYGVTIGNDGRIDLVEGDVEKIPGFVKYEQVK